MVAKVFYMCPIDYKDILTLDLETRSVGIRKCDHVFGYIIPPSHSVREDEICPKQYRIRSWHIGKAIYGVCISFENGVKYVVRDIKKLKEILEELLNYPKDQIIYFILGEFEREKIIDMIKDMIKDMFVGYKANNEFCTPKTITIIGVLNKVTIYFL
ncbi:hypothetical protein SIFV0044 [Sulfolobus islandicus filamentous virus]|uniref:Uncharacterized protein 44 n=1 Tax=Sulfolobus islandicus filamentous virus (isolate Iceland/Hveragerdi) TaxID=654908 RepID=Y044_SIFVH|nr:hypothetical protein SIFV0044 [Sulfolobus islandicus filamentous virus]Q914I8.1 RecName: Full=Uncharacterized protein 44 [Sulfolobus islandicus filamentous virus (isolate Hveragerdi)]AAL27753.1 hypothetical protein [Sulfolobus islandicus filamentous virus]